MEQETTVEELVPVDIDIVCSDKKIPFSSNEELYRWSTLFFEKHFLCHIDEDSFRYIGDGLEVVGELEFNERYGDYICLSIVPKGGFDKPTKCPIYIREFNFKKRELNQLKIAVHQVKKMDKRIPFLHWWPSIFHKYEGYTRINEGY